MSEPGGQGQHGTPAAVVDDGVLTGRHWEPIATQQLPQEPVHRHVGGDLLGGDLQKSRAVGAQLGQPALLHVPPLPAHDNLELSQGGTEVVGPYPRLGGAKGPRVEALAGDANAKGVEEEVSWEPRQRGHAWVLEGPPPGLGSDKQAPALGDKLLKLLDSDIAHGLKAVYAGIAGQTGLNAGVYAPHSEQPTQSPQFRLHHDLASAARVQPADGVEQEGAQLTHGEQDLVAGHNHPAPAVAGSRYDTAVVGIQPQGKG